MFWWSLGCAVEPVAVEGDAFAGCLERFAQPGISAWRLYRSEAEYRAYFYDYDYDHDEDVGDGSWTSNEAQWDAAGCPVARVDIFWQPSPWYSEAGETTTTLTCTCADGALPAECVTEQSHMALDGSGSRATLDRSTYEYDDRGRLIETQTLSSVVTQTWVDGLLVQRASDYGPDGDVDYVLRWTYGDDDLTATYSNAVVEDGVERVLSVHTIARDDLDRVATVEIDSAGDGSIELTTHYTYWHETPFVRRTEQLDAGGGPPWVTTSNWNCPS